MFVFDNVILGVLLLFLLIIFFFVKNIGFNIVSALGILYILTLLEINVFVLTIIGLIMFIISYGFIKDVKINKIMVYYGVFLIIGILLFSSSVMAKNNNNNGLGNNINLDNHGNINKVNKVDVVGKIESQPSMSITGTDYVVNDTGKLQAYLKVGEFPISDAICYANVLYPNMTYFINHTFMSPVNKKYFDGMYYLDFIVPNVTGVYPVTADCFYNGSFIQEFIEQIRVNETEIDDTQDFIINSYYEDGQYFDLIGQGKVCNNVNCTFSIVDTLPIGWYNSLQDYAVLTFIGKTTNAQTTWVDIVDLNNNLTIPLFNFRKSDGIIKKEIILDGFATLTDYELRFTTYDLDGAKVRIDKLDLVITYLGSYVDDLRGNNELVVSNGLSNLVINNNEDQNFISNDLIIELIIVILALILLLNNKLVFGGTLILLFTILYITNIYIALVFGFISLLIIYKGYKDKKQ